MSGQSSIMSGGPVHSTNPNGSSSVVLVCEHASHFIPASFDNLGLPSDALESHFVWDPGALAVAKAMSHKLDAALVSGTISRLVYDCNRPPDAPDAMPARGETVEIPGNIGLTLTERSNRVKEVYEPFHAAVANRIRQISVPILVTVHSFTPVFHGKTRAVDIGVLHDDDMRLVDAMLGCAARHTDLRVARNKPYGPEDGVTHTLKKHAIPAGHLNVMLEIRNDIIQTHGAQDAMAGMIADWLADAFAQTGARGVVACVA